jgi:hypothetical protein
MQLRKYCGLTLHWGLFLLEPGLTLSSIKRAAIVSLFKRELLISISSYYVLRTARDFTVGQFKGLTRTVASRGIYTSIYNIQR